MHTKYRYSIPFAMLFMVGIIAISFKPGHNNFNSALNDSSYLSLALYGKYVYERENCGNCHTLIDSGYNDLVSLDGVGNKYTLGWHYLHFSYIDLVDYDAKMPSFQRLEKQRMDPEKFTLLVNLNSNANFKSSWEQLAFEEKKLRILIDDEVNFKKATPFSEVLALTAYMQSIPSSKYKIAKDSIDKITIDKSQRETAEAYKDFYKNLKAKALRPTEQEIEQGKAIFALNCSACHGDKGQGIIGPNLTDQYWLHGSSTEKIGEVVLQGVMERGMPSVLYSLKPDETIKVILYVNSIKNTNIPEGKAPQGKIENK